MKKPVKRANVVAPSAVNDIRFLDVRQMRVFALFNLGLATAGGERPQLDFSSASICGEAIRNALWALSREGQESVYVTRVLHAAQKLVEPGVLSTGLVEGIGGARTGVANDILDVLREMLDQLETLGDVTELPRGRWLPTPLRCVHLEAIGKWLVVGGIPTSRLRALTGAKIEFGDVARFVSTAPTALDVTVGTQSLEDWYRLPSKDLRTWAEGVITETKLLPFEDQETKFDFYTPGVRMGKAHSSDLQYNRWESNGRALASGRYLVRNFGRYDSARFAIASVERGAVVATGTPELGEGDVRRLMYGFDLLAGRPVRVEVAQGKEKATFVLRNELPNPEKRLFIALGRLLPNADGRYYPRRWEIAQSHMLQAKQALETLGIEVIVG